MKSVLRRQRRQRRHFLKKYEADALMQHEYSAEECLEKLFCKFAVNAVIFPSVVLTYHK